MKAGITLSGIFLSLSLAWAGPVPESEGKIADLAAGETYFSRLQKMYADGSTPTPEEIKEGLGYYSGRCFNEGRATGMIPSGNGLALKSASNLNGPIAEGAEYPYSLVALSNNIGDPEYYDVDWRWDDEVLRSFSFYLGHASLMTQVSEKEGKDAVEVLSETASYRLKKNQWWIMKIARVGEDDPKEAYCYFFKRMYVGEFRPKK